MRLTESQKKAATLFKAAESGDVNAQLRFAESISHTDLPTQLRPVINTILQKEYDQVETTFESYTSKETVQTIGEEEAVKVYGFNQDNIADLNHGETFLPGTLPRIGNRQSYPQLGLQATDKKKAAYQYGEAFGIDWQTIVNSRGARVDLVRDSVTEFGIHARQLEDSKPVKNLVTATGFNTAKLGTAGALAGNPSLEDIVAIQAALEKAQSFKIDGTPVHFSKFVMLVAPGQKGRVQQALSGRIIKKTKGTGGSTIDTVAFEQTIDLGAEITVLENRWLTAINPNFGRGFILIPIGGPRPVLTRNYLAGAERPSFWVKSSNSVNFSGGAVPFMDGDFDSDSISTKVRHVYGSDLLWTEGIVFSNGTNT
ncbi:hypothetical protein G7068_16200 [Leucobacter viscericola]|uniref:Uncharacterized protein n=1 Tax=Leucobacter viscericola TaxID=2714935 RepID=A0A6G7XJI1_9MICO|nr:hypothetical protein [Leucobacter viscericola]QIK64517.1 hypothetical protein G7068_15840 [Leucobacter viscericola]QIK64589.1 hypothetical protein G7068_16200 [Leucobacter viscericola]